MLCHRVLVEAKVKAKAPLSVPRRKLTLGTLTYGVQGEHIRDGGKG